jgi:TRAP transporter 4TM/12TM fusion protein
MKNRSEDGINGERMPVKTKEVQVTITRYDSLPPVLKICFIFMSTIGVALAVFYVFSFSIKGKTLLNVAYYYLLIAIFSSCVFLILPASKRQKKKLPWYDLVAAALTFVISMYFCLHSWDIAYIGWANPTSFNFVLGLILCPLVLEGGRRMAGPFYTGMCIIFGAYPLFASLMPGIFYGRSFSVVRTIGFHVFGSDGLVGLPTKVVGEILIGFLLFAGVLLASGAGKFFIDLALSILGGFRGGPAKVAVLSSGFFGSLSGSPISNVVATGSITIPTMKRLGYPAHYAGAIEACASTGGVLMPPVMGAVAFITCTLLGREYADVAIAATIPAILYYFGVLMQVDAYAAKVGLKGIPREELPSLRRTLKAGWPFIAVFIFLLWGLLYMRWEMMTPFYASGLLLILSYFSKKTMLTPKRIIDALIRVGTLVTQSMAVILPIAFIVGGLTVTGTSASFAVGLVSLGGGNVLVVLLLGVVACYLMGMAGMMISAYIFLAVTLAPALLQISDLNVLAIHLFIIYYTMLAVITPPVAVAAFIGAAIAGSDPLKTSFQAMRLGVVIYFIPFFFIYNPALIFSGPLSETLYLFGLALLGILLISAGMEGYIWKIGSIELLPRPFLVIGGILITFPEMKTTLIGAILSLAAIVFAVVRKNQQKQTEERLKW